MNVVLKGAGYFLAGIGFIVLCIVALSVAPFYLIYKIGRAFSNPEKYED